MKHIHLLLRYALWVAANGMPLWTGAVPLEVVTAWQPLTLKDQYELPVFVGPTMRNVIFAAERLVKLVRVLMTLPR